MISKLPFEQTHSEASEPWVHPFRFFTSHHPSQVFDDFHGVEVGNRSTPSYAVSPTH
jgi:hypothetical protein